MGWFDSAVVKQLMKESEFVGGIAADQAFGNLPPGAADEVVYGETSRARLKTAFDAAAAELGKDKARKKAVGAAGDHARMCAQVRQVPVRDLPQAAERAIGIMLDA